MKLKATKMFKSNIQLDNQHQFSKIDNPFTERWAGHSPNREIIQPKQPSFVEASLAVKASNGSNLLGKKKAYPDWIPNHSLTLRIRYAQKTRLAGQQKKNIYRME